MPNSTRISSRHRPANCTRADWGARTSDATCTQNRKVEPHVRWPRTRQKKSLSSHGQKTGHFPTHSPSRTSASHVLWPLLPHSLAQRSSILKMNPVLRISKLALPARSNVHSHTVVVPEGMSIFLRRKELKIKTSPESRRASPGLPQRGDGGRWWSSIPAPMSRFYVASPGRRMFKLTPVVAVGRPRHTTHVNCETRKKTPSRTMVATHHACNLIAPTRTSLCRISG